MQEPTVNSSNDPQPESLEQRQQPEPYNSAPELSDQLPESGAPAFVDGQFHCLDSRNIVVERTSLLIIWACVSVAILIGIGYLWLTNARPTPFWIACGLGFALTVGCFLFALLWPQLEYSKISFRIDPLGIEIHQGVLWRSQICVPIGRVQHADVGQGPLQRIFGVSTLTLHTAGTSNASVSITGLDHAFAVNVRDWIVHQRKNYDAV